MAMLYIKPCNKGETVTTFVPCVYAVDAILCLSCPLKKVPRTSKKYFNSDFFYIHIYIYFNGLSWKQVGYIIAGMCNCSSVQLNFTFCIISPSKISNHVTFSVFYRCSHVLKVSGNKFHTQSFIA